MNIKCKNCGGILEFDPKIQMLFCGHCHSTFPIESSSGEHKTIFGASHFSSDDMLANELMDVDIYTCASCGAELFINDVELSTYCVYCGHPSIAYSRTEKRIKPQYIIPFKVSKEEALDAIREKFIKSEYVDWADKFFVPELLRGIYVPYGMFCYHIKGKALIKGVPYSPKGNSQQQYQQYFYRKVFSRIGHIPVDASFRFPNKSADRLEPFSDKDLTEFDSRFLSGYYADLRDEDFMQLRSRADMRAKKIYTARMLSIPMVDHTKIVREHMEMECVKEIYALLPVWFLIMEHNGEKYTILVNGQTKKIVGTLPASRKKMIFFFVLTSVLSFCILCPLFFVLIISGYFFVPILSILLGIPLLTYLGFRNSQKYIRSKKLATSEKMKNFAKERQEY